MNRSFVATRVIFLFKDAGLQGMRFSSRGPWQPRSRLAAAAAAAAAAVLAVAVAVDQTEGEDQVVVDDGNETKSR